MARASTRSSPTERATRMFGALGVCLGSGLSLDEAVRYSVAEGSVNVLRHGLGSGRSEEIERLLP